MSNTISAEEIKALMEPVRVCRGASTTSHTKLPFTREQQALSTLQTLLNQAAEALRTCGETRCMTTGVAYQCFSEDAVNQVLATIEPYLTKEGE